MKELDRNLYSVQTTDYKGESEKSVTGTGLPQQKEMFRQSDELLMTEDEPPPVISSGQEDLKGGEREANRWCEELKSYVPREGF